MRLSIIDFLMETIVQSNYNMYKEFVILYLVILSVYFLLDMFLCGKVFARFYNTSVEDVRQKLTHGSVVVYLLTVLLLLVAVIIPALTRGSVANVLILGALFGSTAHLFFWVSNGFVDDDKEANDSVPVMIEVTRGAILGSFVSAIGYMSAPIVGAVFS
jgi:uncharacterized membrane protein